MIKDFKTVIRWGIILGVMGIGLAIFKNVSGRENDTKRVTRKIQLTREKHLTVKIDIGAGIIDLKRSKSGDILNAEVEYDPREIQVDIDYDRNRDEGELHLKSKSKHKGIDLDEEDNYWYLELSDKIPISFEIDVGACEADFDFTGLLVDRLDMDLGASSVDVEFLKPNLEKISKINIDVGASKLIINGLGNANFERLYFEGGVGDFTLDFSGELKHGAYVDVEVGLGKLTILVPEDAGVQVKSESSFLSSVSIDECDFDEIERGLYENSNFGQVKKELLFDIEVGLGSVEVEYINSSL